MDAFNIIGKIFLDDTQFGAAAAKSEKTIGGLASKVGNSLGAISTKVAGVIGAVTAATAGVVALANKALESADKFQRLSDITGLSAERIQELNYVGGQLGVELETITGAQSKLIKSMSAAYTGGKDQAAAFSALGISITDTNGRMLNSNDVMMNAFNSLNKVGNETERDALSMKVFGKSAMELNPLIKAGSEEIARMTKEFDKMGGKLSNEQVKALDDFGDGLQGLGTAFQGMAANVIAKVAPILQVGLDNFKKWVMDINSTIKTSEPQTKQSGASLAGQFVYGFDSVYNAFTNTLNKWAMSVQETFTNVNWAYVGASFGRSLGKGMVQAFALVGDLIGKFLRSFFATLKIGGVDLGASFKIMGRELNPFKDIIDGANQLTFEKLMTPWNEQVFKEDLPKKASRANKAFADSIVKNLKPAVNEAGKELGGNLLDGMVEGGTDKTEKAEKTPYEKMIDTLDIVKEKASNTVNIIGNTLDYLAIKSGLSSNSTEYLTDKIRSLKEQGEALNPVIIETEKAYEIAAAMFGATSSEAVKLKADLTALQLEQAKYTKEILTTSDALLKQAAAQQALQKLLNPSVKANFAQNFESALSSLQSLKNFGYNSKQIYDLAVNNATTRTVMDAEKYKQGGGKLAGDIIIQSVAQSPSDIAKAVKQGLQQAAFGF